MWHLSPGWCCEGLSGSARSFMQRVWRFQPSMCACGDWEESIDHAFFHCDIMRPLCRPIEITWFASWAESFLSSKPVLFVPMWYRQCRGTNTMCSCVCLALCEWLCGQRDRRSFTEMRNFPLLNWSLSLSISLKLRSGRKGCVSPCRNSVKGWRKFCAWCE